MGVICLWVGCVFCILPESKIQGHLPLILRPSASLSEKKTKISGFEADLTNLQRQKGRVVTTTRLRAIIKRLNWGYLRGLVV